MSGYERVALGDYTTEYSERNRALACTDVYSVTNGEGFMPSTEYFNKEVFSKNISSYKTVHRGMFAYNPSRVNVGSLSWLDCKDTVVISPMYVVFKIDEDSLSQPYLNYFLHSDNGIAQIRGLTSGSVRDTLKYSALKQIRVPLPSLKTQHRIVSILDKAQWLIATRRKQIIVLDKLAKDLFAEMFGDPVKNEKGWEAKPLGEKCNIVTGNTPSRSHLEYYGSYMEWIKSDNINTNRTYLTEASEYLSEQGVKRGRTVGADSVLMTCIAGSLSCIGNVAITGRTVAFNQQINAIESNNEVDVFYLFYLLKLAKSIIHEGINKSMKGILSKSKLASKKFIFPPIDLQRVYANKIEKINKQKIHLTDSLAELETLYKSLTQRAFAGELFED